MLVEEPELLLQLMSRSDAEVSLKCVFAVFEEEVKRGRIQGYGVASAFAAANERPPSGTGNDNAHFPLTTLLTLAQEAAGGSSHHLFGVQYPFNLLEPQAVRYAAEPAGATLESVISKHNLIPFALRPVKAMVPRNDLFQQHSLMYKGSFGASRVP